MRTTSTQRGRNGEEQAALFLKRSGYQVIARNVRLHGSELDLVCRDGPSLVVVEVKFRASRSFGSAIAAIDRRKRRALRNAAEDYAQIIAPGVPLRFDLVAIDKYRIVLYRNAF